MRPSLVLCAVLGVACAQSAPPPAPVSDPIAYVDTRLGSGGFGYGAGNCFPGAQVPDGMALVGPDTTGKYARIDFLHFDGYWDGDDTIQGFSQIHLSGTGGSDFGVLSVMPLVSFDPTKRTVEADQQRFSKATEVATPGYYAATLADGIRAELTATNHVAVHRYAFPKGTTRPVLLFDLTHQTGDESVTGAKVQLDAAERRFEGSLTTTGGMSGGYTLYFAGETNEPWTATVWNGQTAPAAGTEVGGAGASFALLLDDAAGAPVELALGLSFVSPAGAAANLAAEEPAVDFDGTKAKAIAAWRARLSSVIAYGGSETDRKMLYSALHHVFVMPETASDAGGAFAYQGHSGQASGFELVSSLSLWDTYRTVNPLYDLVAPDLARDVTLSLDAMDELAGSYPKWPLATSDSGSMVGQSADVVIAEAVLRGVHGVDAEGVYQRLRRAADLDAAPPPEGQVACQDELSDYAVLGYVPACGGRDGTVSVTLEYAQDDFALANLARALGHADDAAKLLARSHGYRKLYDPATGFLRAREKDGSLAPGDVDSKTGAFDPTSWDNYVEADAWQSLWGAPHDAEGTAALLGGKAAAVAKLEQFFELAKQEEAQIDAEIQADPGDVLLQNLPRGYFWAGNEPDIHTPYLFALLGRPDLTEKWLPWIRDTYYRPTPDGLPGNDDGGTMSAWWVFSALGFYPLAGSDTFVVGTPLFPRIDLAVPGGKFVIEAPNVSAKNVYVESVTLDGKALAKPTFEENAIHAGGTLHFDLGPEPSTWGQ